ncbi:hypothetical protein [Streptomyces sp. NPDC096193]|uniref:hypothetical protein n=1 Tax=Streptomyces sp. NPDC096193 TaxID=3155821 RepID=UPI00332588FF
MTAIVSVVAVAISIVVYMESRDASEAAEKREASKIYLTVTEDKNGKYIELKIANTGTTPIRNAVVTLTKNKQPEPVYAYNFGFIAACKQEISPINISPDDPIRIGDLYFQDSSNQFWKRDPLMALQKYSAESFNAKITPLFSPYRADKKSRPTESCG